MTADAYVQSSPGAIWTFNSDGEFYPLPSYTSNPTPSLELGDVTLYTISSFFQQILNSNLLPRFANDMLNCGIKNEKLPSYHDGYAVGKVYPYALYPDILKTTEIQFPALCVYQTNATPVQFTTVKIGMKRDFIISWIMPPMTAQQEFVFMTHQSIAAKAIIGFGSVGYDPKVSTVSAWQSIGLAGGEFGKISLLPFQGMNHDGNKAKFPAISVPFSVWEINQLGLPQNTNGNFESVYLEVDLGDGYNINNPLPNIADGYIIPNLSITSFTPTSGSVQGDTQVFITGNGFNPTGQYTVSFNGAIAKTPFVRSNQLMQVITNPSIGGATGSGNILIQDNLGNSYEISGWSYV